MLLMAVARASFDDIGIRYVLLVLCMTSCFPTIDPIPMACGIGNVYLSIVVINFRRIRTYSPGGATMFQFVMVYNGSKLRTRGIWDDDMRGAANGWWPL